MVRFVQLEAKSDFFYKNNIKSMFLIFSLAFGLCSGQFWGIDESQTMSRYDDSILEHVPVQTMNLRQVPSDNLKVPGAPTDDMDDYSEPSDQFEPAPEEEAQTPEEAADQYLASIKSQLKMYSNFMGENYPEESKLMSLSPDHPMYEVHMFIKRHSFLLQPNSDAITRFLFSNPDPNDPAFLTELAKQTWIARPNINGNCFVNNCVLRTCLGDCIDSEEINKLEKQRSKEGQSYQYAFCGHHRTWFSRLCNVKKEDLLKAIKEIDESAAVDNDDDEQE